MSKHGDDILRGRQKTVWIDLENTPHVFFFRPIINELKRHGNLVTLTARDCFQVCDLADLFELSYERIGRHYGGNKILKVLGLFMRVVQLMPIVMKNKPDLAISHFSRSQMFLARMLGIPFVVIEDYEHGQWLPFISPSRVIVPEVIPDNAIKGEAHKYPGIKEDVYTTGFKADPTVLRQLCLRKEDMIVTIRPPASEAHYHNPQSDKLFFEVVEFLGNYPDIHMVILPRNEKKQTAWIKETWTGWCDTKKIIIPEHVVNGLDLIYFSDFVVSGGGTMNREAAALGVPVYSIFRGEIGAVDRYLSDEGRLIMLENVDDIRTKIRIEQRDKSVEEAKGNGKALDAIMRNVLALLEEG